MTLNDMMDVSLADAFSFNAGPKKQESTEKDVIHMMLNVAKITNEQWGTLDKEDGYNCPKCRNKGEVYKVFRTGADDVYSYPYMATVPCSCMEQRRSYERSRMSGLPEGYTFETFRAMEDWQRDMKRLCENYINNKAWKATDNWLYIGGAIGSGKSHIVTALARELVYYKNVVYMNWVRDSRKLKALVNEDVDYSAQIFRLTQAEVLFIDDFFKSNNITDADKRLAYDILNERYNNHLPTLFTSELYMDEIPDEAISSRIFERAKDYMLNVDRADGKNKRYGR